MYIFFLCCDLYSFTVKPIPIIGKASVCLSVCLAFSCPKAISPCLAWRSLGDLFQAWVSKPSQMHQWNMRTFQFWLDMLSCGATIPKMASIFSLKQPVIYCNWVYDFVSLEVMLNSLPTIFLWTGFIFFLLLSNLFPFMLHTNLANSYNSIKNFS